MLSPDDYFLAGLFMGEGHVGIKRTRHSKNQRLYYQAQVIMRMRKDDLPLLEFAHLHSGGGIIAQVYTSPTSGNPMAQWWLSKTSDVQKFLEMLVAVNPPAKKMRDVRFVLDFMNYRASLPYRVSPESLVEMEKRYQAVKELRAYREG